jgi:hypothetical protein
VVGSVLFCSFIGFFSARLVGRFGSWFFGFLIALFFDLSAFGGLFFRPLFFAPQAGAVLFLVVVWSAWFVAGSVGLISDFFSGLTCFYSLFSVGRFAFFRLYKQDFQGFFGFVFSPLFFTAKP